MIKGYEVIKKEFIKVTNPKQLVEILDKMTGDYTYDLKKLQKNGYTCNKEVYLDAYYKFYQPESKFI